MKRVIAILLLALMVVALVGCSSKPTENKVKTALEDGSITVEDAKAKGWIDDEWIRANFEPVEAGTKIHLFTPFETTYLDGTAVSSDIIEGKMCLVFFNTQKDNTMEKLQSFNNIYENMATAGVPILGIITDEE